MSHQMMLRRDDAMAGEMNIPFRILGEWYFPEHVMLLGVLRQFGRQTEGIQRIAGRLCA